MGWWDEGIFGGDTPLDILIDVEACLGLEGDERIYSTDLFKDKEQLRQKVCDRINLQWDTYIGKRDELLKRYGRDSDIVTQVFATVLMGVGARMPEEFRRQAVLAGQNDDWASEDTERRGRMNEYVHAVEEYKDGCPVTLTQRGLFEKVFEKLN